LKLGVDLTGAEEVTLEAPVEYFDPEDSWILLWMCAAVTSCCTSIKAGMGDIPLI